MLRRPCEEGTTPVTAAGRVRAGEGLRQDPWERQASLGGGHEFTGTIRASRKPFGSRQDGNGWGLRTESGAKDGSGSPAGQRGGEVGVGGVAGAAALGSWMVSGSVTVASHRPGAS